jgi:hypothetical protein
MVGTSNLPYVRIGGIIGVAIGVLLPPSHRFSVEDYGRCCQDLSHRVGSKTIERNGAECGNMIRMGGFSQ